MTEIVADRPRYTARARADAGGDNEEMVNVYIETMWP